MQILTYLAVLTVLLLAACSSSPAAPPSPTSRPGTDPPAATASPSATIERPPTAVGTPRCGVNDGVAMHSFDLRVGAAILPAGWAGSGPNVAILLHQTDGDGACGWFPVAGMIAAQHVRVVTFDLCGYGAARCPAVAPKPAQQVSAAVRWARAHGAQRVTVIGASMGGSIALGTAATVAPTAVVDLSGPMTWTDVPDSAATARTLHIPLLAAASPGDADSDPAALRRAVDSSPGVHRFVSVSQGHGIEMLTSYANSKESPTPLLQRVIRWIIGDYS